MSEKRPRRKAKFLAKLGECQYCDKRRAADLAKLHRWRQGKREEALKKTEKFRKDNPQYQSRS